MIIHIEHHHSYSDCECCGVSSAERMEIYTPDRSLDVVLGDYASCFTSGYIDNREPYDVINGYLDSIGYNDVPKMPIEPDYEPIDKLLSSVDYHSERLSLEETIIIENHQKAVQEYDKFFYNSNMIEYYNTHGIQLMIETTEDELEELFEYIEDEEDDEL